MERRPAGDENRSRRFHQIRQVERWIVRPIRIGRGNDIARRRRGCLSASHGIDQVVNADDFDVYVTARGVNQVIAADCEQIAIAGVNHNVQLGVCQLQAGGEWNSATVRGVERVLFDVAGNTPGATGCTGRVAGYVKQDSFHTTHGRAIPFATGLKLANPKLNVVVYSGDGDLFAIGGNHLIHAARRNVDIKVICINNLIYAMTGGQTAPTTPSDVITSTNPYGTYDPSFNLPYLVEAAGAVYVARWTAFHVRQLARSMQEMFAKKGFSFIEVLSPCPTLYQRRNKMGDGLDTMKFYKEVSKVRK